MDMSDTGLDSRFEAYVSQLTAVLGHADRAGPFQAYCGALLLPIERKSVEPLAAVTDPGHASARHQSLMHIVSQAAWSDVSVLGKVYDLVLPVLERTGGVQALIVDDTGFAKKGVHSVGVARQYCGRLGKQDNCQVAVTLSAASRTMSLPVGYRLFLPQDWAADPARRAKAGVPDDIVFQSKPQIALELIEQASARGITPEVVLADAGYGASSAWREALTQRGLAYLVGIAANTSIWPPGEAPLPAKPWSGRGRPPSALRRSADHAPVSVEDFARAHQEAFEPVLWREGSNTRLSSRFAAFRVRPAHRDSARITPHPVEWMIIEWPDGEEGPTKFWFSTLPATMSLNDLVELAKRRWLIERDYQELKSELGLAHFEGRSWRGFHHHATLCIAAYAFLLIERAALPPSATNNPKTPCLPQAARSGSSTAAPGTPCAKLHRNPAQVPRPSNRRQTAAMSLLPRSQEQPVFMTQ